jgi:hypothetical protein
MSDKVMVIKKSNDEIGELELISIDPIIKKLELEKADIQEQKQTRNKARTKAIEFEIKDIYEKAEKLVDLNTQINLG